ncbi:MAG: FAD-binding oxidoreductase [Alphaproteobacteria bacterium]|jgi:D-amino-acid dehydrogenase|nr:FAD-binding oxidoreductase [Alphaproteobacteria bacterium]
MLVVGGGIVGLCNALALQRAGYRVSLIDRGTPGRETSYGNAGVLSESSVAVLNSPGLLKALPKLLLGRSNGLRYSPLFVVKRLGWMLRFLSHCTPRHWRAAARALRELQVLSLAQHKDWIAEAGVQDLLRHGGWMKVFRSEASFAAYAAELALYDEVGVRYTVFDREQLRQIEPGLKPIYEKAVLFDDTCGVSNPAALTDAYLALFTAAGGIVVEGSVTSLRQHGNGWEVRFAGADDSVLNGDGVVLAAGAWTAEIARWLGYDLPLGWERGYHLHLAPADGPQLNRAVNDMDGGFVIAPMQQGVRITSGVELTDRDAPPDYKQIRTSVAMAREAHDMKAELETEPWMGRRPTMVDSLPVIGPAPRHRGLWFNFGHQHVGLSMAPGSALAITAMVDGTSPPLDTTPFRAERFSV